MAPVNRIGFTQLHGKTGARDGPYRVNIIFVHGLRGHPRYTWESGGGVDTNDEYSTPSKKRSPLRSFFKRKQPTPIAGLSQAEDVYPPPRLFWPDDYLTADIPEARIWTYGYNADVIGGLFKANNQNSISKHGQDLKVQIEREIDNEDPILFVAHSLGGVIVKDMLHRSTPCQTRTKLIVFLGTPHRGSSFADWGQIASNLARLALQDSNKKIIQTLEINSEVLGNIHEQFKKVIHNHGIKVHSFQEAKSITGVKGLHDKVVNEFSSKLDLVESIETVESIDANHMEMARCNSRSDERYRKIQGVLRQFLNKGVLTGGLSRGQGMSQETNAMVADIGEEPAHPVHHVIPFAKNQRFIERTQFSDIKRLMFEETYQRVALVGLGGAGKTQIALNTAYWVKENNKRNTDIAKELGIPPNTQGEDIKMSVKQFLSSEKAGCWLLIVDNADDIKILCESADDQKGLINYLPRSDNGVTLFTTRSREVALSVADDAMVQLDAMSLPEAEALLRKTILRKQLLQDHKSVIKLLGFLTNLPLAITQASAYLNRQEHMSIASYLQLLQGTEENLISMISHNFQDRTRYPNSPNAIATTWLVSFKQVEEIDSYAAGLLYFISRIEPKSIPRSILPFPDSDTPEADLEYAIGTLSSYTFLVQRDETQTFDMHSLVHLATRIWAKKFVDKNIEEDAVQHLNIIFPSASHENRLIWRQYLPHALKILNDSTQVETDEKLDLQLQVGRCLLQDARTKEAIRLLGHVVEVRESTLDEGHPSRLASQHALAGAYEADGRIKEAIKLLEHVVKVQESKLDEGHPYRLASQHELAGAYKADGRIKEAIKLLEHVVEVEESTLDEGHPSRLASQHALAGAYKADGRIEEAIKLLEHVVEVQESTLDEGHPDRLASQHALAGAYEADGRIKEAIKLLEHVVKVRESTLDEGHPSRLASQHVLAGAYEADGRVKEAIKLLEHVVEVRESTLDEGHPYRLASQHALAGAYEADGRVKEAIRLPL